MTDEAGAPTVDAAVAVDAAPPPQPSPAPDAADGAGPGPDCTRAAAAKTAPASLFDAFMTDETGLTAPADREA